MASNLSNDVILVEILPRLPVKSIIRFKCVSKPFHTTISSHDFAKRHLRHHYPSGDDTNHFLILPGRGRVSCYNLDSSLATETFSWNYPFLVSIIGSSNGLLCVFRPLDVYKLSIINPMTRIGLDISTPINLGKYPNLGFAFDHSNLDYKIVIVYDHLDKKAIRTRITYVFSLNMKSWKIVESAIVIDSMEQKHDSGVLIDYHLLHWMFWSPSLGKRRISCFDVCQSKWVEDVLLPRYYYDPEHKNYLLDFGVFDGRLFSSFQNTDDNCFDIWVMRNYRVQYSWFKLFSIPVSNDFETGLNVVTCRADSGQILIRVRRSSKLYWYNMADGELTEALFDVKPDFSDLRPNICSKSIVDIPGGHLN